MEKTYKARRDFKAMERRRQRAARMFKAGKPQAEVARVLKVSRESVSRWHEKYREGGAAALRGAGRAGRKPRLDREGLKRVDRALREGARAHGFATDLWTLPRIARVIERITGVRHHPGHVWRVLRRLNWTLQRPAKRARERNEAAVRRWVAERWPAVKKTPAAAAPGLSSKTRAGSRNVPPSAGPGRPKGKRPS
jgi:transposase